MTENDLTISLQKLEKSTFYEVLSFVRKRNYFSNSWTNKDCELFWLSNLPLKWFNNFLNESSSDEFLFAYFSKPENANQDFIKLFISSNHLNKLIKIIKLSEAFKLDSHWNSFSVFKNKIELKPVYKELEFIRNYQQYWDSEFLKYTSIIKQINYEDILIQVISYYEQFKRYSNKSRNNREIITSYETHLISILNTILNLKKEYISKTKIKVQTNYSIGNFKYTVKKQLPKIRTVESFKNNHPIPEENIDELKRIFRDLIEFSFTKEDNEYQIQKYLTGLADFEMIDGLEAELKTNNNYSLYRNTLEKGIYDETYFTNRVIDCEEELKEIKKLSNSWEKQLKLDTASSIEYFKFLKIPLLINDKRSKLDIDLEKTLLLLKSFSLFLIPQGRIIINDVVFKRELPKEFSDLFYSDYIVIYEEKELITKCQKYFKWSEKEIKSIIDFLTTDLSSEQEFEINIKRCPIIKIGNQYFWLSSFQRDRRWEITLHHKIINEKLINHLGQSSNLEKYISDIFKEVNFGSVASHSYKHNKSTGEIDVLAYKQNTLFLFELKSTYIEEDIMNTSKYEVLKFSSKASSQLNKAKEYVLNRFEEIKGIKELQINCKKEDLNVVTIIISNSYQSDNLLFDNKHLKISLFELLIILKNDLYNMLVPKMSEALFDFNLDIPMDAMLKIQNRSNPKYKNKNIQLDKNECNLWEDINNCTPNDIISAIKENKVWKHQNAKIEAIELKKFDKNYKYLI